MNLQDFVQYLRLEFLDDPYKWNDESYLQMIVASLFSIDSKLEKLIQQNDEEILSIEVNKFASKIAEKTEEKIG